MITGFGFFVQATTALVLCLSLFSGYAAAAVDDNLPILTATALVKTSGAGQGWALPRALRHLLIVAGARATTWFRSMCMRASVSFLKPIVLA